MSDRGVILGLLEAHIFYKAIAQCKCGAELGSRGNRNIAWREHVADVIAEAMS